MLTGSEFDLSLGETLVDFTARRGSRAYHCHLLFHMEAGMFREVRVEE